MEVFISVTESVEYKLSSLYKVFYTMGEAGKDLLNIRFHIYDLDILFRFILNNSKLSQ